MSAVLLGVEGAHQGPVTETGILWAAFESDRSSRSENCLSVLPDHKLSQVHLRSLALFIFLCWIA